MLSSTGAACGPPRGQVPFRPVAAARPRWNSARRLPLSNLRLRARNPHHAGKGRAMRDMAAREDGVNEIEDLWTEPGGEPNAEALEDHEEDEEQDIYDDEEFMHDDDEYDDEDGEMEGYDYDEDDDDEDDDDDDDDEFGEDEDDLSEYEYNLDEDQDDGGREEAPPLRRSPKELQKLLEKQKPNRLYQEEVIQIRRVAKASKGGKKLRFRAVVGACCEPGCMDRMPWDSYAGERPDASTERLL